MDIYYCVGLFIDIPFRRFPVVDNGRIAGAITRFDPLCAVRGGYTWRPREDAPLPDVP